MVDLPEELPAETRVAYARLVAAERPVRREILTMRVATYLSHIESAAADYGQMNVPLALALGQALLQLIDRCPEEHSPHLRAAVAYFAHSDDADHDFESPLGFDDDVAVFNAVCGHVGLPDLKVSGP